jgi:hypothetical protein
MKYEGSTVSLVLAPLVCSEIHGIWNSIRLELKLWRFPKTKKIALSILTVGASKASPEFGSSEKPAQILEIFHGWNGK